MQKNLIFLEEIFSLENTRSSTKSIGEPIEEFKNKMNYKNLDDLPTLARNNLKYYQNDKCTTAEHIKLLEINLKCTAPISGEL